MPPANSLQLPQVMGILNVTPDSFSDGGHFFSIDTALRQANLMVKEGADIIDIGGESTRPGAQSVPLQEELDRVMPVIEKIRAECSINGVTEVWQPSPLQIKYKFASCTYKGHRELCNKIPIMMM